MKRNPKHPQTSPHERPGRMVCFFHRWGDWLMGAALGGLAVAVLAFAVYVMDRDRKLTELWNWYERIQAVTALQQQQRLPTAPAPASTEVPK